MLVVDGLLTNISLYVQAKAAPKGPVQFDHSDYRDFNLAHVSGSCHLVLILGGLHSTDPKCSLCWVLKFSGSQPFWH